MPVAWLRTVLGGILALEAVRFWAYQYPWRWWAGPRHHFKYAGFEWLKPVGLAETHGLVVLLGLCGLAIAWGRWTRLVSGLAFFIWAYLMLLDQATYQNHWYLYGLLLGMMAAVGPERGTSTVPRIVQDGFRLQVGIVYLFAGLVKLEPDWLGGYTTAGFILGHAGHACGLAWIGEALGVRTGAFLLAWGGTLFDLMVFPALIFPRTRTLGALAAVAFHLMNWNLFDIGTFPLFGFLSLGLFLFVDLSPSSRVRALSSWISGVQDPASTACPPLGRGLTGLLALHLAFQLAWPLRSFPPILTAWDEHAWPPEWSGVSMLFSWRMKKRYMRGDVRFLLRDPQKDEARVIHPTEFLTPRQDMVSLDDPEYLRQAATWVADAARRAGVIVPEVRVLSQVSMNGRPYQPRVDPQRNLALEPRQAGFPDWAIPLVDREPGARPEEPPTRGPHGPRGPLRAGDRTARPARAAQPPARRRAAGSRSTLPGRPRAEPSRLPTGSSSAPEVR